MTIARSRRTQAATGTTSRRRRKSGGRRQNSQTPNHLLTSGASLLQRYPRSLLTWHPQPFDGRVSDKGRSAARQETSQELEAHDQRHATRRKGHSAQGRLGRHWHADRGCPCDKAGDRRRPREVEKALVDVRHTVLASQGQACQVAGDPRTYGAEQRRASAVCKEAAAVHRELE